MEMGKQVFNYHDDADAERPLEHQVLDNEGGMIREVVKASVEAEAATSAGNLAVTQAGVKDPVADGSQTSRVEEAN